MFAVIIGVCAVVCGVLVIKAGLIGMSQRNN